MNQDVTKARSSLGTPLHHLAALSRASDDEAYFRRLGEALSALISDAIVIVNSIDEGRGTARVESIEGLASGFFGRFVSVLGFDPVGKTFNILPQFRAIYNGEGLARVDDGVQAFSGSELSARVAHHLGTMLGVGAVYSAGLLSKGRLLASVHLLLRHRSELPEIQFLNDFLSAASGLLQHRVAESALSEQGKQLNALLDTTDAQVWYLLDENTYGEVNRAHAEFIGLTPEEASFKPMSEILSEEAVATCRAGNRLVFASGEPLSTEEWLVDPKGEPRLLSISKTPQIGDDGRVDRVVCVGIDITESHRAKERMLRFGRLERILTEASSAFLRATTPGQLQTDVVEVLGRLGETLGADRAFLRIVDETAPIPSGIYQWHAGDLRAMEPVFEAPENGHRAPWQRLLVDEGVIMLPDLSTLSGHHDRERERLWAQGVEAALVAAVYSARAELYGFVGFAARERLDWDETAVELVKTLSSSIAAALRRLSLETEVREANERLQATLDGTGAGTWEWNITTGETVFDEGWAGMLGYTLAELMPTSIGTWKKLTHPEDLLRAGEALERHFSGETDRYDCELRMRHKEGHWVWIQDRGQVVARADDGSPLRAFGTHIDISARKRAEAELAESHALLESVFDGMQDGINILDADMRVLRMNAWMERRYGATEALAGRRCFEVFHARSEVCDECPVAVSRKSGRVEIADREVTDRDGNRLWIQLTSHPLFGPDGVLTGFVEHSKDITREKEAQEALEKSEAKYRSLFENMSAGFALHEVVTDAEGTPRDYVFLEMNPAFEEMTGLTREAAIGKSVRDLAPNIESDPADWIGRYGRVAVTGEAMQFESYSRELERWFSVTAYSPGPGLFATVFEDITGRKQMEESLAAKTAELERFFTVSLDLLAIADTEGRFQRLNAAWEQILGYPIADLEGRPFLDFVHPDDVDATLEAMKALGEQKKVINFVNRYRAADGSYRWIEWRSHPEGGVVYAAARDVTERIEREEAALEASRAKSSFLANMSHELRTPLNGIVGFSDLLRESDLPPAYRSYVENIHTSGETLMSLINDILDFSKIEAGRMELDPRPVDLPGLLENAVQTVRFVAEKKGLRLVPNLDRSMPRFVEVDSVRLTQVLVNLLGNAVKFTEEGEIELKIVLRKRTRKSVRLEFSVRDTGIGIAPENQEVIFDSFTQADPSATRKFGGTGLGLAISNRIIELMGDRLRLESAVGEGSTFSFVVDLPLGNRRVHASSISGAAGVPRAENHPGLPAKPSRRDPLILVAEDERMNALVAQTMIRRILPEARVVAAADGEEAVALFQTEKPDLVLMDIQMPRLDGYAAARKIRSLEAEATAGPRVPMLALTAGVIAGERERCLDAGMDDYISKPIVIRTLEDAFRDWL